MSRLPSLVLPSVTTLRLTHTHLEEQRWRDLFMLSASSIRRVRRTLWEDYRDASLMSLSDCLPKQQTAGFKLGHLKMIGRSGLFAGVEGFQEEFGPVVEMVVATDL